MLTSVKRYTWSHYLNIVLRRILVSVDSRSHYMVSNKPPITDFLNWPLCFLMQVFISLRQTILYLLLWLLLAQSLFLFILMTSWLLATISPRLRFSKAFFLHTSKLRILAHSNISLILKLPFLNKVSSSTNASMHSISYLIVVNLMIGHLTFPWNKILSLQIMTTPSSSTFMPITA